MQKQQYQWLALAAMLAASKAQAEDAKDVLPWAIIENITAAYGTFRHAPVEAANGAASCMFIFQLVFA